MKSKRGFTLVELLAVIVILGILLSISTVAVNNIRKTQDEKNFENQISSVLTGAKSYIVDNPSKIYNVTTQTVEIDVETLIKDDYVSIDSKFLKKFNGKKVEINPCISKSEWGGGVSSSKLKYSIEIDNKPYNDCGCKGQDSGTGESAKLCTD